MNNPRFIQIKSLFPLHTKSEKREFEAWHKARELEARAFMYEYDARADALTTEQNKRIPF